MSLFTLTLEVGNVVEGDETDIYGNPVTTMEWAESPAWVEQMNSTSNDFRGDLTTASLRVFLPLTTPVDQTSRIRWDGYVWSVDGEPARQPGGFIVEGFQLLQMSRSEG